MFFVSVYQKSQRCSFRWYHKRTKSGQSFYGTDSGISRFRRFQQTSHPLCLRFTKYRKWRTDCVPQWNTCHSYAGQYGYSGVFTLVRKDSMILIDGGMINNYPVDVARSMGADIIIGVDVQNNLKGIDKLNSAPDILSQIIDLTTKNNHQSNVGLTDTYIKVNVEGYSSASFTPAAIDSLMHQEK